MSDSFALLHPKVQRLIYERGWTALTPIQDRAIPVIATGKSHALLVAETASGKTEAAFLPAISNTLDALPHSLKILYVSPLKALINDQNKRLTALLEDLDVPVQRWHGDVAASQKSKLVKEPRGILQITPESMEGLLINRTRELARLVADVEFVIIDELHAFLGSARGTHARSVIARVSEYAKTSPRLIALSATIGDVGAAARWLHHHDPSSVAIIDAAKAGRGTDYCVMHFPRGKGGSLPLELFEDIELLTREMKAIVFVNSKSELETAAAFLNRLSRKHTGSERFLVHHANVSATEREWVEEKLRAPDSMHTALATSTLELGIDIGSLDLVCQLDSTYSVSSLKQRLGRSGRRAGGRRTFMLYSTTDEDLLQAVAVTELFLSGWVEPPREENEPWDLLWHQLVSLARERAVPREKLIKRAMSSMAFGSLDADETGRLLDDMLTAEHLEEIPGSREIIPGLEAERELGGREWYAVFETPREFEVLEKEKLIGTLPVDAALNVGVTVLLAGRKWVIVDLDADRLRLYVEQATQGKAPIFFGAGGSVHQSVRDKMHDLLRAEGTPDYAQGSAETALRSMRQAYAALRLAPQERAVVAGEKAGTAVAMLFAGSEEVRTLCAVLGHAGIPSRPIGFGHVAAHAEPTEVLRILNRPDDWPKAGEVVAALPYEALAPTKFGRFLPEWAQRRHYAARNLQIDAAMRLVRRLQLIIQ